MSNLVTCEDDRYPITTPNGNCWDCGDTVEAGYELCLACYNG